uniref:Calcineurin-like phosphoesterase domain-containing protein n=1 Tax=Chromera velia CCMP2878 TaxID=1169474 RepID=A0A0G4FV87_9ALVE|eukprot:Cvel_18927.t1-p1 / transcript=Cvel_18927.t1 / gene=Cvel_18927 / organism=Chromera_velia_CCMP2878 / gene_product=Uncharacterized protein C1840.07c, putative / transcript_product=Uncharacterized protein C1840.07c, putative / location=Cvel_scaffold1597:1885-3420(-) / protein_length=346 / sequence_SO=supercontig / SO=protein_coding / is_pseudo=false
MGDIHSDGRNAAKILSLAKIVDERGSWNAGDAIVVQLGDVVDRGPDTKVLYAWFRKLRKEAEDAGGRFIQLLGNHEPMQTVGMLDYVHPADTVAYGGAKQRAQAFSETGADGKYIRNLDTAVIINQTLFVHAGLTPKFAQMGLQKVNAESRRVLKEAHANFQNILWDPNGPLWNRHYSMGPAESACAELEETFRILGSGVKRMIVGHTIQEGGQVRTRCDGKLILADTGASRFIQNRPTLVEFFADGSVKELSIRMGPDSRAVLHSRVLSVSDDADELVEVEELLPDEPVDSEMGASFFDGEGDIDLLGALDSEEGGGGGGGRTTEEAEQTGGVCEGRNDDRCLEL